MSVTPQLKRQVEQILDEATTDQVDVIVQMESDRSQSKQLATAAGTALSRPHLGESGQDHRYGFGRLDILRAIDFAVQRDYGL